MSEELFDYKYNWHYDEWEWWMDGKLLYTANGDEVEMQMNRDEEIMTKLEAFKVLCAKAMFYRLTKSSKFVVTVLTLHLFNA